MMTEQLWPKKERPNLVEKRAMVLEQLQLFGGAELVEGNQKYNVMMSEKVHALFVEMHEKMKVN